MAIFEHHWIVAELIRHPEVALLAHIVIGIHQRWWTIDLIWYLIHVAWHREIAVFC
jgi:hypothetical protein